MIPDLVTHHCTPALVSQSKSQPRLTMWLACTRSSLCPLEPDAVSNTAREPLAEMKASLLPGTQRQRQHNQQLCPMILVKILNPLIYVLNDSRQSIITNLNQSEVTIEVTWPSDDQSLASIGRCAPSRPQLPISWCGMWGECMIGTLAAGTGGVTQYRGDNSHGDFNNKWIFRLKLQQKCWYLPLAATSPCPVSAGSFCGAQGAAACLQRWCRGSGEHSPLLTQCLYCKLS